MAAPCPPVHLSGKVLLALEANEGAVLDDTYHQPLDRDLAQRLAQLPLHSLERVYPNKLDHVINGPQDLVSPPELHPAFYGSYDWHSCVHGHWMLVRLLKTYPDLAGAPEIRRILGKHITAQNVAREVEYLKQPNRQSFERPYGWTWLLKLQTELHRSTDPQLQQLSKNLQPLSSALAERYCSFFPKQNYPIRSGVHSDTAFGLSFALEYARAVGDTRLEGVICERSRSYYLKDKNFPISWEPGGDQFLSPGLAEAELMAAVLRPEDYSEWLGEFLPDLAGGRVALNPAVVLDRSDPKLVHLDGLNLSRAWMMRRICKSLPADHPAHEALDRSAREHLQLGLASVSSGDYAGEHWLASFAVLASSEFAQP